MLNILLVEDNAGFRNLLKELFNESILKFRLFEANDPIEGLQLLKNQNYNFDYIICDFFLPIQNGNDFLEIVKSHNKNIICLLVSSDVSLRSKKAPGIDYFFDKHDVTSILKFLETHSFIKF